MEYGLVSAAYISASVLFILSLGGLSNQEKAKRAVWFGIAGMGLSVFFTVFGGSSGNFWLLFPMILIGSAIGIYVAQKVEMTEMPQLVAALHSFVGLAAVFIGINSAMLPHSDMNSTQYMIHNVEVFIGVFIGIFSKEILGEQIGDIIIGVSVLTGTFIFMPLFLALRWKGKKLKDYTLSEENIRKMREKADEF